MELIYNQTINANKRSLEIGKQFGVLTVIADAGVINKNSYSYCRCTCGVIKAIRNSNLKDGKTKSCGCSKLKMKEIL